MTENDVLIAVLVRFKEFKGGLIFGLVCFGCWLATLSPISATSATIALYPQEGSVGTWVTVEGSGFAPFAEVTIEFGEDPVPTTANPVNADEFGKFVAGFEIPQFTSAGNKTIAATDNSETSNSAYSLFLVYNTAPVAGSLSPIFVAENSSELISLNGSDVNGDTLTFFIVESPSHGVLSDLDSDSGEVLYTPETSYVGSDEFSFGVNDGYLNSNKSAISIHIGEEGDENSAPVPQDQSVNTDEDTSVEITLVAFDIDADELEFRVEDNPQHGTLEGDPPDLVYVPSANYAGLDSFTYTVDDGRPEGTSLGTINITVAAVNDLPVAFNKSVEVIENSQTEIILSVTDADGDSLSYMIVVEPRYGNLTGNAPNLSYAAAEGYTGLDSFKFVTRDDMGEGNTATVSIEIVTADEEEYDEEEYEEYDEEEYDDMNDIGSNGYENAAPMANSQSVSGTEDIQIHANLSASDSDYDDLFFEIIDYPLHGILSGFDAENGTLIYTPLTDYNGPDSFTFKASDAIEDSETAIVSIDITAVNDPPQVIGQNLIIDNSASITLTALDAEGEPLRYSILSEPIHGILTGAAPNLVYGVIDADFSGEDSFTFVVSDGKSETIGAVLITIRDPTEFSEDTANGEQGKGDSDAASDPPFRPSQDSTNNGGDGSSNIMHVENGNTIIQLMWEHDHQTSGVESTLNLQFSNRMTRLPLSGHIWYDLVILDYDNNEIFKKQDLIALNSQDVQKIAFPEDAVYRIEVIVKGVVDKDSNSVIQDGAYTGVAIGMVVVPEFNLAWLMIIAASVMSSVTLVLRFAGKSRR